MQIADNNGVLQYPYSVQDVDFHPELNTLITKYGTCKDILHTVFYGPPSSGKLTLARKLISIHTNVSTPYNLRLCYHKVKEREFPFYKSSVHFEMDINDFAPSHQCYLMDLMQELARTLNVSRNSYKIIMLRNAEKLTRTVQHQLRRMMELFYNTCRLIFLTASIDCLDPTIRSRLVSIRVPLMNKECIKWNLPQSQQQPQLPCLSVSEWLNKQHHIHNTPSILQHVIQQLWKVLNKSTFSATSVRKWTRLIFFTHLPIYDVLYDLYLKICSRFQKDIHLHIHLPCQLIFLINYYLQLYETGTRKEFHIEMILCCMYMAMHHHDEFLSIYEQSMQDNL